MKYSLQDIVQAIDVAIEMDTYESILWALNCPQTTTDQLLEILDKKRCNKFRLLAVKHKSSSIEVLKKIGKSRSSAIFLAIMENDCYDQQIKDAWLNDIAFLRRLCENRWNYTNKSYVPGVSYCFKYALENSTLSDVVKKDIKNRIKEVGNRLLLDGQII